MFKFCFINLVGYYMTFILIFFPVLKLVYFLNPLYIKIVNRVTLLLIKFYI